jgi:enoyl-CoA hydratase/carnithine racemase
VSRTFSEYADRYPHVAMRREDGILELRLHSDGGPLVWGAEPHAELGHAFTDVGADRENRVVIITGTGDRFLAALDDSWVGPMSPEKWDTIFSNGKRLLSRLLDIEVPVIGAVNGPASVHAELALLSDLVVCADHAYFSDAPHFRYGTVPSDGVHVVWPLLLGFNRARHFLLTGQRISAQEALGLGVVGEVVPAAELSHRAWALARELIRQPPTTLRYTREAFAHQLRRLLDENVPYGLALEGLGAYASWPRGDR